MPRRSYRYEADPYGDSYGGGYGRGGYSGYGYSPYGRGDRIVDLILAGGDIAAQGAQRSGEIWGSAIGQIGETIGAGIQNYSEARKAEQLAMRDKALVGALESWDGKDPRALFGSLGRIADPKTAMEWTQGALAFQGLTDKADKENAARFQELGKRMASVSYPVFERLWPGVQPKVAPVAEKLMGIPADQIPAQPTQETYETIRQLFGEKSELIKGQPGEVFFDKDGNVKFSVPAAAKEAKKYQVTVAGPDRRPVTRLATEEEMTQGVSEYVKPEGTSGLSPSMESNVINRLTAQWDKAVAPAKELDRNVKLMESGLEAARRGDAAAGAQAVLVTFQKMLDPRSVVRESEYARSAAGQALLARIQGAAERLVRGGAGVPVAELEKFAQLAREMVGRSGGEYVRAIKERIGRTADRYKIPRDVVFEDFSFGATAGPSGQGRKIGRFTVEPE